MNFDMTNIEETLPTKSVGKRHQPVVYVAGTIYGGCVKIGTTMNLRSRLNRLNRGKDFEMFYVAVTPGDSSVERVIHRSLAGSRINGNAEYFWLTPQVQQFTRKIDTPDSKQFLQWSLEHR